MSGTNIPREWLPSLPRRYAATVVDGLLILGAIIMPTIVLPEGSFLRAVRIAIALGAIFVYEPLCTGHFTTLGQWVARVRVRRFETGAKIGMPRAIGRLIVKWLLGILSFLSLPFAPGRRALHDMATGTIVLMADAESSFAQWAKEQDWTT